MADDFFKGNEDKPEAEVSDSITVGEKEYSQEELARVVELGEIGRESEEKYDTKIDKVWPNLQKTINEKKEIEAKAAELEAKLEELENAKIEQRAGAGEQLSQEELKKQALAQAKDLGIITSDTFADEVKKIVYEQQAAADILKNTNRVVKQMEKKGYPKATVEDLLEFMNDKDNPADPEKAYKLKYEREIDMIKEQKIKGIKPEGMITGAGSTAGSKAPPSSEPITRDNLAEKLRAHFGES